jgi:hypothetical protein
MRVIVIGCEYSGVSTLINALHDWGRERGINHHLDDHFTIPDAFHLSTKEQQAMLEMLPAIKERFQRFQIVYHIRLLHLYRHILLGGFHLEEAVYGHRYYYPGKVQEVREYEPSMPDDTILVHLAARPEVIRERMRTTPHPHSLVPEADVEEILDAYTVEFSKSWFLKRFQIDTSELTGEQLLETFLRLSIPHLNAEDTALRQLTP